MAVFRSLNDASKYIPVKLLEATGMELHTVVAGIIPGLLMFLGVLCATTVLGGAVGAAIGFLAGGVGAVPCAAIGAELGLEAGIALLDFLGLAFLAAYIGKSLLDACKVSGHAVQRAWRAPETPSTQAHEIDAAAREQARAVALVFCGLLQGLVAFLLAKGTAAAASRVPELVANLRNSKHGAGFASWVEKNWKSLIDNPRLMARSELVRPVAEASPAPPVAPKKVAKPPPKEQSNSKLPVSSKMPKKLGKQDLADWYKKQGEYFHDKKNLENHLEGTDFSKPVELKELPAETKVIQYVRSDGKPGMYFSRPGTPMEQLGIKEPPLREMIVSQRVV